MITVLSIEVYTLILTAVFTSVLKKYFKKVASLLISSQFIHLFSVLVSEKMKTKMQNPLTAVLYSEIIAFINHNKPRNVQKKNQENVTQPLTLV